MTIRQPMGYNSPKSTILLKVFCCFLKLPQDFALLHLIYSRFVSITNFICENQTRLHNRCKTLSNYLSSFLLDQGLESVPYTSGVRRLLVRLSDRIFVGCCHNPQIIPSIHLVVCIVACTSSLFFGPHNII